MEELLNGIAQAAKKILGRSAFTMLSGIKGITVDGENIKLASENPKAVDEMVGAYQKIVGPVSKTIAMSGAVPVIKKNKAKMSELKKVLPAWIFESPELKGS